MGIGLLEEQISPLATARQREILAMCREDAARLEHLVGDLLDLSKIESGRLSARLCARQRRTPFSERGCPAEPGPERERHRVAGRDRSEPARRDGRPMAEIERVVANLIANAVSATPRGGRIVVSAHRTDERVEVSVADTGRGIPREYLPRLFGKFTQVPGAATGNTSLGLAISQQIVRAHGGDIRVASEPGRGATFTFVLPVARTPTDSVRETQS